MVLAVLAAVVLAASGTTAGVLLQIRRARRAVRIPRRPPYAPSSAEIRGRWQISRLGPDLLDTPARNTAGIRDPNTPARPGPARIPQPRHRVNTRKGNPLDTNETSTETQPRLSPLVLQLRQWHARIATWVEDVTDWRPRGGQVLALAAMAVVAAFGAALLSVWLLTQLVHLVTALLDGHPDAHLGPVASVALDPIGAWAAQHAAGLPVPPATLLTVWALGGGALFLAGMAGSRGAQVTWPLYGAATAAMAWAGAAEPHRPVAAGLIALAWGVLSIAVLHRGRPVRTHITSTAPIRVRVPMRPRTRTPKPSSASRPR